MLDGMEKVANDQFWNNLDSGNPALIKSAEDALTAYTRMKLRERGFARSIMPPIQVSNDQLTRAIDHERPVVVLDKENNIPAAVSVGFGTAPTNKIIEGPRYSVAFSRIQSPAFVKDVDLLRTYQMDIRQVTSDNAIKDIQAEEDGTLIAVINSLLGAEGSTVAETGTVQHAVIGGGITRASIADARKILPRTPSNLEAATVLVNSVTMKDIEKWGRDEIGGDMSEEILREGYSDRTIMNMRWIVTIKRRLVPDNTMFFFAEPKFLGKFLTLTDTVMYIERKAYMLKFFAWESIGMAIANSAAIAKVRFE